MALKLPQLKINKTWLMLLVATGLALLATMLTTSYLKSREASIAAEVKAKAEGGPKVSVVVPTRDLPAGGPLDGNLVAARDVAADLIYPDAILAADFDKVAGKSLIHPVLKGRPLLMSDLGMGATSADFAGTLENGKRAITVDVDELNSVAHMIKPGNLVDLMLGMRRDDGGQTVVPFMYRMKVLATGQRVEHEIDDQGGEGRKKTYSYANLTLEVTPVQAARLALATDIGKLRFVLRNEKDKNEADFSVNTQNILDEIAERVHDSAVRASAVKRVSPRKLADAGTVEFIIGGQRAATGASAKSVEVPMPGLNPNVPAIAPPAAGDPAAPAAPGANANNLTPEMKAEIKKLIE